MIIFPTTMELTAWFTPAPTTTRRLRAARGVAKANQALGLMNLVEAEFRREFIGEGQLFWFYKRQNRTQIPSSKDFNNMITMEKSFYLFDLPQDEKDKRGVE